MIRVLFVVHFPVFGGPHNQALRLSAPLTTRGFETVVVVPAEPGNAAGRLIAGGVDVRVLPLHRLRATTAPSAQFGMLRGFLAEIQSLRALIRTERISIVQVGGLVNPHAAIAARLEHVPVVWQLLDTRAPWLVATAAMVWVRELADVVMSTGLGVAEAHPRYPAVADRVIPFYPPVDLDRFEPRAGSRAEVRSEWGVSPEDQVIGCVANINAQKGIIELVHAFARVHAGRADSKLVLVGAEHGTHVDYSAAVRAQMANDGLIEGRDVLFIGARDDIERQLAGMEIFALAAAPRSEGITTAVLEAMAAGLPVVVTDVGALREAVDDGRSGFVIPPHKMESFERALTLLLDDPALRERMGQEGRRIAVARFGVDACADTHVRAYSLALAFRGRARPDEKLGGPEAVVERLAPARVVDGIPIYSDDFWSNMHDEIDHGHKAEQARHYDRMAEEAFETQRPHGTPHLYRFLLAEKFRRAIRPIRSRVFGASALIVCGGSGMDGEFFVRAGMTVVSSDLSIGAAVRAKARAERYDLAMRSIVADVEHLPYADQSFDLVAVHDGLHHLANPSHGLSEMARVARQWVVVTEPAQASITRVAISLGLALETEEAGNRVARLDPAVVAACLETHGFVVLRAGRYAMYYPHRPGAVFSLLSRPFVYPFVRVGWRLANALFGRVGNKMVVVAERKAEPKE